MDGRLKTGRVGLVQWQQLTLGAHVFRRGCLVASLARHATEMVEEFAKNIEMVSSFLGLSPAGTGSTIPGDHQ
jgi:hypothetical protein